MLQRTTQDSRKEETEQIIITISIIYFELVFPTVPLCISSPVIPFSMTWSFIHTRTDDDSLSREKPTK